VPGFTSEEIRTQIDKFLTTQVTSDRTKLGLRDTLSMRNQVYDILSTTLLLRPDSFFYLVWLTSNKLEGLRAAQAEDLATIQELDDFLEYRTKRITSTTELTNAQAAILQLNAGLNDRRTGQGIRGSIGPAVDRFRRSSDRFIHAELEPNVVREGVVTETPEEIRATIGERLQSILARHGNIKELAEALVEATARLDAVRLPETAVQAIVGRISDSLELVQETLEGDDALSESREAMLELLVMGTVLKKASSFGTPQETLAPLAGDATTLTLGGEGTPGSLLGMVSGPFNYDSTATNLLRTQVGTPPTQIDITLPGGSNASVRTPPTGGAAFTGAEDFSISVDGGFPQAFLVAGVHGSAAALAAYLDALPIGGATVTAVGSRVVITSDSFGDSSSIEVFISTAAQAAFIALVPLEIPYNRGEGVGIEEILDAVGAATAGISAEEVKEEFDAVSGTVSSGTPTVIDAVLSSGADLVMTADSPVVTSPSINFELLGVRAGMGLNVTAVEEFVILSVDKSTLTLTTDSPVTTTGTYEVGPDFRSVPDGARVILSADVNFRNTGAYRVDVGGGSIAHLVLDRSLSITPAMEAVSGNIFTSYLKVSAIAVGALEGIATFPADAGLTALGFTASAVQDQGLSASASSAVDLLARGVRPGDRLSLSVAGTPLPDQTVGTLDPATLTFSPGVEFQASDPTFSIGSERRGSWETLRIAVQAWLDDEAQSTTDDLEFQVSRLVRGANPSATIDATLTAYAKGLDVLQAASAAYVVPEERGILNVIRTLDEQGMDRARDLLINLELTDFFQMPKDSVSYSTHLIRTMADESRELVPVGKRWKSKTPNTQYEILSTRDHPTSRQNDPLNQ